MRVHAQTASEHKETQNQTGIHRPWSVGPSPTQVDATSIVAIGTLQEPPPALPIRASSHVGDTQENQGQFYYSGPPLGLPPVSGACVVFEAFLGCLASSAFFVWCSPAGGCVQSTADF
jgi:hypothetical protein